MVSYFDDELVQHLSDDIIDVEKHRNMLQIRSCRSRLYIMLAKNLLAQISAKPTQYLTKCMHRIFGCLKLKKRLALQYNIIDNSDEILTFHSDSDFGGDQVSLKSRSGWMSSVYRFMFICNRQNQSCTKLLLTPGA